MSGAQSSATVAKININFFVNIDVGSVVGSAINTGWPDSAWAQSDAKGTNDEASTKATKTAPPGFTKNK